MKLSKLYQAMLLPTALTVCSSTALAQSEIANETDRMLVKYSAPLVMAINNSLSTAPNAITTGMTATGVSVVDLKDVKTLEEVERLAEEMREQPGVLYAEPDYRMLPQAVDPNDPRYLQEQWHYYEADGGINLPAAWDITTGSSDVVVAVIDSGVLLNHPDLQGQLVDGYDFISSASNAKDGDGRDADPNDVGDAAGAGDCGWGRPFEDTDSSWHGTHVAGTIAAASNNGIGVAGVAWGVKILPVRALGKCGGYTSDITDAMRWSAGLSVAGVPNNANPAKILNMSLGGNGSCSTTYQEAINEVVNAGATVVVAAGNSNANAANYNPASCDNIISVAATKRDGGRAEYSNYGSVVDVAAPGGEKYTGPESDAILSTISDATDAHDDVRSSYTYGWKEGTSMATPHVAGVAALMLSVNNSLTPSEVKSILQTTARSFPSVSTRQCGTSTCGAGIIDAAAAVLKAKGDEPTPQPDNALEKGKSITLSGADGSKTYFTFEVPENASNLTFVMGGGSGDADLYVRYGDKPTMADYDCRPWKDGNSESCAETAKAGTWHVMIHGYDAFTNTTLIADYEDGSTNPPEPEPEQNEFTNSTSASIPDNSSAGVNSTIDVTRSGIAGTVAVTVSITHTYRGDIAIKLSAPDGTTKSLKSISGSDSTDNVNATYTVDFGSASASGTWTLNVSDNYNQDTGQLNNWKLVF